MAAITSHLATHVAARGLIAHAAPVIEIASVVEVTPVVKAIEIATASVIEASRLLVIAILVASRYILGKGLEGVVMRGVEYCGGLLGMCLVFEQLFDLVLQSRGSLR